MLECTFKCTVCKQSFRKRNSWLKHLLTPEHQKPAIVGSAQWDDANRECALVVYSTLPVASMEILTFFSSFGSPVSDFMWNPTRPKVGIVQYESRELVEEIFRRNAVTSIRSEVKIKNCTLQMKKACSLLLLEWKDMILSTEGTPNSFSSRPSTSSPSFENVRVSNGSTPSSSSNRPTVTHDITISSSSSSSDSSDTDTDSDGTTLCTNTVSSSSNNNATASSSNKKNVVSSSSSNGRNVPSTSSSSNNNKKSSNKSQSQLNEPPTSTTHSSSIGELKSEPLEACAVVAMMDETIENADVDGSVLELPNQFTEMFKKIIIQRSKYVAGRHVVKAVKDELMKIYPSTTLVLFRHWYLELLTMGNPEMLIFVDIEGFWKGNGDPNLVRRTGDNLNKREVLEILDSADFQKKIPGFTRMPKDERFKLSDPIGTVYLHKPTTTRLNFVFDQGLIPEAQSSRLLRYLSVFDPLAMPLLKVVRYWAKANKIRFAEYLITDPHNPHISPEPSGMEWLVMFFLIHEGFVPSPREITARPHQKLPYTYPSGTVDIGFTLEDKYHKIWAADSSPNSASNARLLQDADSDAFHLSVFKLAWQFFTFYSTRITRWEPVVFNMRDGEILLISDILHKKPGQGWKTRLETKELEILKNIPSLRESKLFLLHPLSMKCSFSLCQPTFLTVTRPVMKETATKIEKAFGKIHKHQQDRIREPININISSVFNIGLAERIDPAMKKRTGNRGSAACSRTRSTRVINPRKKGRQRSY